MVNKSSLHVFFILLKSLELVRMVMLDLEEVVTIEREVFS